jgi:hypothetical protein
MVRGYMFPLLMTKLSEEKGAQGARATAAGLNRSATKVQIISEQHAKVRRLQDSNLRPQRGIAIELSAALTHSRLSR